MRIFVLMAWGWCAVPALAQADGPAPDARQLGITEAMLDYCAKAYPSSTVKFQYQVTRLTKGTSAESLSNVRSIEPYRRAHEAEADFIGKVDPRNAKKVCSKPLVAKK